MFSKHPEQLKKMLSEDIAIIQKCCGLLILLRNISSPHVLGAYSVATSKPPGGADSFTNFWHFC